MKREPARTGDCIHLVQFTLAPRIDWTSYWPCHVFVTRVVKHNIVARPCDERVASAASDRQILHERGGMALQLDIKASGVRRHVVSCRLNLR